MGVESYEWWMNSFWFTPNQASFVTVFTSLFVHADIFHLLGNMVYLFLFGATVEDVLGRGKFFLLYLVGGVAAVFGHVALTAGHFASDLPLGGASGAISTCMGAFLLLLPKTSIEFRFFGLFFFRPFSREFTLRGWIVMSFWFLSDLFWAVLEMAGLSESDGTAFGAHVGGFLLGMSAVGLPKMWQRRAEPTHSAVLATLSPRTAQRVIQPTADRPFLVYQNDEQFGPYTGAEVQQYLEDGSIIPEAVYWQQGMAEWRSVSELLTTAVRV
jgi:membrane associated rhomboid family serine protease